jgi:hemerythrin-like metal-binding protein
MYQWEEKYSIGIQSIDNQHKEIFKLLNSLLEAMKQGQAASVTSQIILELEKYSRTHFQKEEYFFKRFNYSGAASHILEHQVFIQKINLLKSELTTGKFVLCIELLNFMKNWIEHHILEVDMQYSEFFLQNGLK